MNNRHKYKRFSKMSRNQLLSYFIRTRKDKGRGPRFMRVKKYKRYFK